MKICGQLAGLGSRWLRFVGTLCSSCRKEDFKSSTTHLENKRLIEAWFITEISLCCHHSHMISAVSFQDADSSIFFFFLVAWLFKNVNEKTMNGWLCEWWGPTAFLRMRYTQAKTRWISENVLFVNVIKPEEVFLIIIKTIFSTSYNNTFYTACILPARCAILFSARKAGCL